MSTFDVSWVQPQSLIWGECLYFVGGKQLWVVYQILYVKNVILALADLNSGAAGATANALDLLGRLPMVWEVAECLQLRKPILVYSPIFKNCLDSGQIMPSMILRVNFLSLSMIQVEIHLSCLMNLRVKVLIHNCIWDGLFCNHLVIKMVTKERTCSSRRLGVGINPAAKKDSIPSCSANSYMPDFSGILWEVWKNWIETQCVL